MSSILTLRNSDPNRLRNPIFVCLTQQPLHLNQQSTVFDRKITFNHKFLSCTVREIENLVILRRDFYLSKIRENIQTRTTQTMTTTAYTPQSSSRTVLFSPHFIVFHRISGHFWDWLHRLATNTLRVKSHVVFGRVKTIISS